MKTFFIAASLLLISDAYGHGGDDGPSSLEDEFSKLSHLHLPVNYSTHHGLSFGFPSANHESEAHHDEHHESDHEDVHGDETGIEINVHPVMFGGYDKIKRLVNLEVAEGNTTTISLATENSKFQLLENKKWDLGLGMEGDLHLPNPLFSTGMGVSFLKGKTYYSMRMLNHHREKRAPLKLPINAEKLKTWRVGDQLSFATKGSLIFNVFVGIEPFVHIGPEYIHSGTYRVKAVLESENHLEIQIVTTSSDSYGIEGNAIAFNGDWMKGKGHLNSVVYEFDLTNEKSFEAISYLFHGRLDLTNQEMLHSDGDIRVRTSMQNGSTSFSGSFGLPVLYLNGGGSGVYQNEGLIQEREEGEMHSTELFSTTFMQEKFTRGILSKHRWENNSIVSTILRHEEHSLISSVFSWSFSKDVMKEKLILKKLKKLSRIFGRPKLENIQFPVNELGYLKADMTLGLSGRDVLSLLDTAELSALKVKSLEQLNADFNLYGHKAFCRIKTYNNCLKHYQQRIINKHSRLKRLVLLLDEDYKKNAYQEVTRKLSLLVKELFSSRYLTQTFTALRPKLKIELRLEGERIKKHVLSI